MKFDWVPQGLREKVITIRKYNVLKAVMLCDYNYATDKETRDNVSGIVTTLKRNLLTCLSNTQRAITLSRMEA